LNYRLDRFEKNLPTAIFRRAVAFKVFTVWLLLQAELLAELLAPRVRWQKVRVPQQEVPRVA
jgi:hypothetical protein